MKVDVLNIEGEKLREVELPSAIFEAPINIDLMHQAYVRQMFRTIQGDFLMKHHHISTANHLSV